MPFVKRIRRRIRTMLQPTRVASEIADEMQAHIEWETEDLIRRGVAPDEGASSRAYRVRRGRSVHRRSP
jgi:hypothetical protein